MVSGTAFRRKLPGLLPGRALALNPICPLSSWEPLSESRRSEICWVDNPWLLLECPVGSWEAPSSHEERSAPHPLLL